MAYFSSRERLLARLLSRTPWLKGTIKNFYIKTCYIFNKKNYRYKLHLNQICKVNVIDPIEPADETFFGYYDKSPENKDGWVIFNETAYNTQKKPSSNRPLWINIINLSTKEIIPISNTFSYNWQQGCRALWVDENYLIFNIFNGKSYNSCIYSIVEGKIVKTFDRAVQDSHRFDYFLSINYQRIMRLRPDYGYRNLPLLTDCELRETENDGIWRTDFSSSKERLVVSIHELEQLSPESSFKGSYHKVNHVMISPDGQSFIFIHRWYSSGRRHDRLIWSDFSRLRIISDEDMVSHMCWIDNDRLFGYLRHTGKDGFYFINLVTGEFTSCNAINDLRLGDGHPAYHDGWIVFDSYPDKGRMQHLYLYNIERDSVMELLELFQSTRYNGENRCDLHPRFSPDGFRIYFDTVFSGSRRLAYIDVSNIIHSK